MVAQYDCQHQAASFVGNPTDLLPASVQNGTNELCKER